MQITVRCYDVPEEQLRSYRAVLAMVLYYRNFPKISSQNKGVVVLLLLEVILPYHPAKEITGNSVSKKGEKWQSQTDSN